MNDKPQFPELPKSGADLKEIVRFQEQLLKYARDTGDRLGEGKTLQGIGSMYLLMGETKRGVDCLSQALHIAVETGDIGTQGHALYQISNAAMSAGVVDDNALNMARAALKIFERMGDPTADLVRLLLNKYEKKK